MKAAKGLDAALTLFGVLYRNGDEAIVMIRSMVQNRVRILIEYLDAC